MYLALQDDTGTTFASVNMALGWDPARRRWFSGRVKDIDLNASALLFAGDRMVDVVYHEQLTSRDGSVRHLGDSTTGEGDGDDEIIAVDLTRLPAEVTSVFFIVTCYTGQTFDHIRNAFCRLVDGVSRTEIARFDLTADRSHTGLVMGRMFLAPEGVWQFETIGEGIRAEHPVEAVPQLAAFLP